MLPVNDHHHRYQYYVARERSSHSLRQGFVVRPVQSMNVVVVLGHNHNCVCGVKQRKECGMPRLETRMRVVGCGNLIRVRVGLDYCGGAGLIDRSCVHAFMHYITASLCNLRTTQGFSLAMPASNRQRLGQCSIALQRDL